MTMFLAPYTAIADIDGSPLDAGFLFFGEYGKDPELFPVEVFWDVDFTVPAAQPIRTRNGYPVRNGSPAKTYLKVAKHSISIKNRKGAFVLVDFYNKGLADSFFVSWSGRTQEQENKSLAASVYYHIDNLEDAQKYLGYIVEYQGKHFKVSSEQSKDVRHPVIRSGDTYLIPHDYTAMGLNVGSLTPKGLITSTAYFNKSGGTSHQGFVVDNVNNSVFITSAKTDTTNIGCVVFEYDFTGGVLGALKATSGTLSMGHGDCFAVTTDSTNRHLWFYKPNAGDQYNTVGNIVRVPWLNGCSDENIDKTISSALVESDVKLEVVNYDQDNLLIIGSAHNIVSLVSLESGTVDIVEKRSMQWTPFILDPVSWRQQSKAIVGMQSAASGVLIRQTDSAFFAMSDSEGVASAFQNVVNPSSVDDEELEGLDFWWNSLTMQYEPIVTGWEWSTSKVNIYNLASNRTAAKQVSRSKYFTTRIGGQVGSGQRNTLYTPTNIACTGILIGSSARSDKPDNINDPSKFYMEQWNNGQSGRYSAQIVYEDFEMVLDGKDDVSVEQGLRLRINNSNRYHFTHDGLNIGHFKSKGAQQFASLHIVDNQKAGVYVDSTGGWDVPSYLTFATYMDFAVRSGSMKFGEFNPVTLSSVRWFYANGEKISPYLTNILDLGGTTQRFKKAWLNQLNLGSLSVYADNAAAVSGGLVVGDVYRTATGQLMIVY